MEPIRGRGRGRGIRRPELKPEVEQVPQGNPEPQASTSIGRGRGRGRARDVLVPPKLPELSSDVYVALPENPEDDSFLDAFRRLTMIQEGCPQGRGFNFDGCPNPSDSKDPGIAARSTLLSAGITGNIPTSTLPPPSVRIAVESQDIGSEDYRGVERETVVKRGHTGKVYYRLMYDIRVPIIANFVRLGVAQEMGLFHYHVNFEPEVESFRLKKKLLCCLTNDFGTAREFDGSNLYLATPLPDNQDLSFTVAYPDEPDREVAIKLKFVKKNTLTQCVHFYNILFRRIMEKLGLVEMKRHFYNYKAVYDIPHHKLEIWPGYVTSIDECEGGLLLCCDSSSRVLQTATVLDVWNNFLADGDFETSKVRFMEYIVGKIVVTKYNNRRYRIDDVDWTQSPRSRFTTSKQQTVTFVQYYKNRHNLTVRDMAQPMLAHRPKSPKNGFVSMILLVPELCHVTGLEASVTSNYHVMKDLTRYTRLAPPQRKLALKKLIENVNNCPEAKSMLDMWGVTLEEAGVNLEGRTLTIPQICNDSFLY